MLKALIFDLGGVIVPLDFPRGYHLMAGRCALPVEEVRRRITELDLVVPYESGQVESAEFVDRVCAALGVTMSEEEFMGFWANIFGAETLLPESLFESLKGRYRLVLLSNTNDLHWRFIEKNYPLLRHFDHHTLSFRVKAMKPSPAIYQAAVEAAGCRPEECFFTDDIDKYIDGARAFGIQAVQFQNYAQIAGELRGRGVELA